ncbi:MAG: RimK family alpha-L-glutamate ligase [Desulfobacteraceae bacterium]|nr:RimK family alpha-L-glutamate ligase [Desulfobacteraceae bacterium]
MNIGILTINNFEFHPNMRLKEAAKEYGHTITLLNPYDMVAGIKNGIFSFDISHTKEKIDIILPRQGAPMGEYGLVLLRQFKRLGIPLVNGLEGVTLTRNQYMTLQALSSVHIPVPDTIFITDPKGFFRAVDHLGGYPVIIKQVDGMGGTGVIKADAKNHFPNKIKALLQAKKGLVIQKFIPPEGRKDFRILVIERQVVGAMSLVPTGNEFRTNINQNGVARKADLDPELVNLALNCTKACKLDIAGIDLVVGKDGTPMVLEVNYSPGFKGLEKATGLDIAGLIMAFITSTYARKQKHK